DCLYINVFTPQVGVFSYIPHDSILRLFQLPSEDNNVSLSVMFFIHGGAFKDGTSMDSASDLIIENDIILVTINYRLGPLGFLSTQDEIVPGNNGLKDQLLALQWAHNNINLFGGDPEKVTIFGQSAGSASCAYHLLNQQSQGLFRGAILQSGSSLSPWAYQRNAREVAFATAALINDTFSTNNDSAELLNFLRTVDANVLTAAAQKMQPSPEYTEVYQGLFWAPVIEVKNPDAFITKKMYGLLQANNIVAVPLLIGMTSEESLGLRDITSKIVDV
ncbi:COesterase and/or Abhydrolase 3 domain containing protein, partial [Asbolus verrucosus]